MLRKPRSLALAAICISASITPASAAVRIDPAVAKQYFEEALAVSERDGGVLWGRALYGPMLFVDPASGTVVANQGDSEGKLTPTEGVFVGTLDGDLSVANTAQEWAGVRWTTVIWPLPTDRYDRRRLMAHELFHRIQDDLGFAMASPVNSHLGTRDGRIWLRLEWRALAEALIRAGEEKRRAIGDVVLFREYRQSLFPESAIEERELELNEGLAEYTGVKLSGLPDSVLADRAAIRLARDESGENLQRSFAYACGPAYGLLLDQAVDAGATPGWRKTLGAGGDLGRRLAAAYSIESPDDLAARAKASARRYDGDRVIAGETEREKGRQARLATYRKRFVDGAVLVLRAAAEFNYSFNPYGIETLPGAGEVYRTISVTDLWGELKVTGGGALMSRGEFLEVRVPAPDDPAARPLAGDGWELRIDDGWTLAKGERPGDYTLKPTE